MSHRRIFLLHDDENVSLSAPSTPCPLNMLPGLELLPLSLFSANELVFHCAVNAIQRNLVVFESISQRDCQRPLTFCCARFHRLDETIESRDYSPRMSSRACSSMSDGVWVSDFMSRTMSSLLTWESDILTTFFGLAVRSWSVWRKAKTWRLRISWYPEWFCYWDVRLNKSFFKIV